ncbi:MAG: hypothetical protein ACFFKA_06835, partial [Candidatus Thorarchaeota archaeon]
LELRIRNHPKLVKALVNIKKNSQFIELYEKIYKHHGRLYSSSESTIRPEFYRYKFKLLNNYRPPKDVNLMIILPELDIKGEKSPSINMWIEKIFFERSNSDNVHICFFSIVYGIIPEELIDSYPLGQYEVTIPLNPVASVYDISFEVTKVFLDKFSARYKKIFILTPLTFFNEFNELSKISKNHPIYRLSNTLIEIYGNKVKTFNEIEDLINELNLE